MTAVRSIIPSRLGLKSQRGLALLVILALVLVAFTSVAIGNLSTNRLQQQRQDTTAKALIRARDAIMAYALYNPNLLPAAQIPGTLPCPDTDGDGVSNPLVGVCTSVRGLVPYKTLSMDQPLDTTGRPMWANDAPLWYVVPSNYAGTLGPGVLRNSSLASNLTVFNNTLGLQQTMAFIVIAPGKALTGQVPIKNPLANVTAFLEGENANGTLNTYDDLQDATHNDQILGMPIGSFWSSVEKLVLSVVSTQTAAYSSIAACGVYPWAVPFMSVGENSVLNTYEGRFPMGTALPTNWGTGCAAGVTLPAWLTTHWVRTLYMAICLQALPSNPPTAACLQLVGTNTANVLAIVMAPGAPLVGQVRGPAATINNYFEGTNITTGDNIFSDIKSASHTAAANDLIHTVP